MKHVPKADDIVTFLACLVLCASVRNAMRFTGTIIKKLFLVVVFGGGWGGVCAQRAQHMQLKRQNWRVLG